MIEKFEFLEYVFGLSNSVIGIMLVIYVSKGIMRSDNYKNISRLEKKLLIGISLAVVFLSFFSVWHFIREIFDLKKSYGSIVEFPEYIFISLVYIVLFWQLMFFDSPINNKKQNSLQKEENNVQKSCSLGGKKNDLSNIKDN